MSPSPEPASKPRGQPLGGRDEVFSGDNPRSRPAELATPRPLFADPKTDFAFKRIFGSEEHKDVLVAFLNTMLDLDEAHRIASVELLPPEQRPPVAELKLSIVDVKCTDAHGVTYVVEMQVLQVEGFEKRVVYNVAKAYVNQIARGDGYPNLNDVVGITICDSSGPTPTAAGCRCSAAGA